MKKKKLNSSKKQRYRQKKKRKKKKSVLPTIMVALSFLFGLAIFLYPAFSNFLMERSQMMVVKTYDSNVKKTSKKEKENLKTQMDSYNQSRGVSGPSLDSAFGGRTDSSYAGVQPNAVNEAGVGVFDVMQARLGPALATLTIKKLSLELPIYRGTSDDVLQKGLGWLEGSSLPTGGIGTHAVITGHRGLPSAELFTDLPDLKVKDQFVITILDEKIAYEVDQILTVEPEETDALSIVPGEDLVTLVTCTPYMINSHRLLVRGHRVPYAEEEAEALSAGQIKEYGWIMIPIAVVLLFVMTFFKRLKKRRSK